MPEFGAKTVPLKMKCFQDVVSSEHTEFLCEAHTPPTSSLQTHKILQVKRHEHDFQKTTSKGISIMSVQGDFIINSTEVNSTGSNQRYTDGILHFLTGGVKTPILIIIVFVLQHMLYTSVVSCGLVG